MQQLMTLQVSCSLFNADDELSSRVCKYWTQSRSIPQHTTGSIKIETHVYLIVVRETSEQSLSEFILL